tara:strand:+ start:2374 stop:2532 length:159 start_codon:yes stop_codon:yes gene_type:complete
MAACTAWQGCAQDDPERGGVRGGQVEGTGGREPKLADIMLDNVVLKDLPGKI